MKKVLMIAYHYPPVQGSSGVHRTLSFSRYLPENGWTPIILTVTPGAFPNTEPEQLADIPRGVLVERAFAIDSGRHLAVRGRHIKALAMPDRWISWWLTGVLKGMYLVRKHRPDVLWSTYPISTAHLIGATLHRLTGIPWVADFRDPMTEIDPITGEQHPRDPGLRRIYGWIERVTFRNSARVVVTTPGAARMYAQRYKWFSSRGVSLIANGYDEEAFRNLPAAETPISENRRLVLVHSGLLYPAARDPRPLLAALGELRNLGDISAASLHVMFRGSGSEALFRKFANEAQVEELVSFEPPVPYAAALAEMVRADGLLLLQGSNCNAQVPAKLYEYLRAGRPILAFTDSAGDTAAILKAEGVDSIAPLDSKDRIVESLRSFLLSIRRGNVTASPPASVKHHSRQARTRELGTLLDSVIPIH